MKRLLLSALSALFFLSAMAYSRAGERIATTWGENIDPNNVWQEYPRPIMERNDWKNLNGLWNY
ncbi:MAG: beta-galactosidase, partial [Muribaculaceae bacterium]|nr:beta-galactosidase [Muribaculaceae bacterium]